MAKLQFDEIGYWSEVKLEIVRQYATKYSQVVTNQKRPSFHHVYIDGFAGAGMHISKSTGEFVEGSPLNALAVKPPFKEYFLVDLDGTKVEHLRDLVRARNDVHILHGDCNEVLLRQVFPHVRYEDYRRGLCLLDPYGLHLDWEVVLEAGHMRSLEIFLNFPVMDMNRNALWHEPDKVSARNQHRMNRFWGDDSWRRLLYRPAPQLGLFGLEEEKLDNAAVADAYRLRLVEVAGFKFVPAPLPMRNSTGAVVYYLFFASQNQTGETILKAIFDSYRDREA
jgi:three-Cys-motif partner protein